MRTAYRVLAAVIILLVVVQAAGTAWFTSGLARHLIAGGTIDSAEIDINNLPFTAVWGVIIHMISGLYVIPALAIILLIIGYLTHDRKALTLAMAVTVLVAIQVALGLGAKALTGLAFLHGVNALLILGVTVLAFLAFRSRPTVTDTSPEAEMPRRPVGSGV
ncbi:hypothetical protein EAH68_01925 [Corynebacterium hylobatis]|uniref:Cytochrome oxidase assembly protein n=1 Tax=Corynebacterium hylobatis TaxID=1859290 RepID=A0A430I1P9_9CORY|nr:hypothetical protein [Corynebacterium hylobatis]RSZ65537.1 hypothetical protein EAH68_01925 [Corynebacterium hylobatis]